MIKTSDVNGINVERHRKWVIYDMTYDAVAKMMGLPKGWSIVSIKDNFTNNSLSVKLIAPNVKDIPEGVEIPTIMPGQVGWEGVR